MIPLEQQVTSLEISKRLKELGVKQESLFYWSRVNYDKVLWEILRDGGYISKIGEEEVPHFSAFTVAELGEMLPCEITPPDVMGEKQKTRNVQFDFWEEQVNDFYQIKRVYRVSVGSIQFKADTEADARGKMLIYLLENKLITPIIHT